jgi:hypothetical protein
MQIIFLNNFISFVKMWFTWVILHFVIGNGVIRYWKWFTQKVYSHFKKSYQQFSKQCRDSIDNLFIKLIKDRNKLKSLSSTTMKRKTFQFNAIHLDWNLILPLNLSHWKLIFIIANHWRKKLKEKWAHIVCLRNVKIKKSTLNFFRNFCKFFAIVILDFFEILGGKKVISMGT